tara:strand:+ start:45 stop:1133 length:1089 start_codon:yes stop_codon:yes gene_type:complete
MSDDNKVQDINKKELVDPKGGNEENTNVDGSSDKENLRTEYTVLVNGERITLYTDKWGASLQDKLEGHGIHIQRNGDIALLSGKGGKGKACGGRLLINTAGGQLIKSGSTTAEYSGSKNSAVEGKGSSSNSENSTAYSGMYWGDKTEEIKGTHTINAQHIELVADTISLKGESKIIIETPELIQNIDSAETKLVTEKKEVDSSNTEVKEETTSTFDPRGSKNIVTTGHLNHRVLGDYSLNVDGYMDLQVMGGIPKVAGVAKPLIENRSAALTIGVNGVKNGGKFFVFTKGTFDLASGLTTGDLNFSTLGKFQTSSTLETKIEATTDITVEATKGITMEAKTDNITIDAKKDVVIEGAKIYLN